MRVLYFLVLFFLLCLTACHNPKDATDIQGRSVYLSEYHGKWIFLNYWATWCQPCMTELPELNAFYQQHTDQLVVLGVNFDGLPNADIQKFSNSLHLTFPLFSSFPHEKFGIHDISSLPVTFVITPQGKLLTTLYGPQTTASLLKSMKEN